MAKKKDGGFQSQAGLVRYFDTKNDKAPKIGPKTIIGLALGMSIVILVLNAFFPM